MPFYSAFILLPGALHLAVALLARIYAPESDAWRIVLRMGVSITGVGPSTAVAEIF